jgi:hypothetical protein
LVALAVIETAAFVNFVKRVVQDELDVLAQHGLRERRGLLRCQRKILCRVELNSHTLRVLIFLYGGVNPLVAVLEEILAGDELRLLRILQEPFLRLRD